MQGGLRFHLELATLVELVELVAIVGGWANGKKSQATTKCNKVTFVGGNL